MKNTNKVLILGATGGIGGEIARKGVVSENESMVTPVFATPILTTSWLA
ncbi:TPA: hypothetical protein R4E95_004594 [Salmonella enterica subsp. enterica serovar Mbandaka]|nr:hypothetical protein [Salmonella enterica subsp. enterica serovar Mbandaka]